MTRAAVLWFGLRIFSTESSRTAVPPFGRMGVDMKRPGKFLLAFSLLFVPGVPAQTPPATPLLQIDLKAATVPSSPLLHGLMTEEINFSYDGGLYGELIRNRAFRNDEKGPVNWELVKAPGAEAEMALTEKKPLTDRLPVSLEVKVKAAASGQRVAIANEGYWGIPVKPATTYHASFYVKGGSDRTNQFAGKLTVSLESSDGATVYARGETPAVNARWQKIEVPLTTAAEAPITSACKFVISTETPGTLWLSLVSLFPPTYKGRANGNRPDIMEKLAAMKPKFLRFPGGNYVEGDKLWERFDWKATRGPLPFRPGHRSCWGYRSTDGLGLLEFMEWCEDLDMEAVLAVFAGYSLAQQPVEPGPLLDFYVQEALEEVEYLTGDAQKTYWGAQRAKDGHPKPFALRYIEVGNEDSFDRSRSYDERFAQFFDAFKARYPKLQLIATMRVKSRVPEVIDDHFYRRAEIFFNDLHHYDNADRKGPKIFVGEWATREGSPTPNFNAALGDAAWMTAMERNSDIVIMQAYAPLFVNVNPGGMQWKTDLIGYDGLSSYGSPAYWAQVMFSNHRGDAIVKAAWQEPPAQVLPYSVTRDTKTGRVFIKLVNRAAAAQPIHVRLQGARAVAPEGEAVLLSAKDPTDTNSITEPDKIRPVTSKIGYCTDDFTYSLAPYSITILKLNVKP